MADVDAAIAFLPRFTTLVGASSFTTLPLDVSRFGSAQFQIWRGPLRGTTPTFLAYLEESLDAEHWVLGPSTPTGYDPATDDPTLVRPKLFSYGFRLRWFRVRVELGGTNPGVTCWAEGLLRDGGGGGAWVSSPQSSQSAASMRSPVTNVGAMIGPPAADLGRRKGMTPPWADGTPLTKLPFVGK
ncbi:MAG: hypothetical protein K8T90_18680 [Planctomycetes bacterium]|nr:hypothetical protein [Planctomycetota bacterium]